MFHSTIAPQQRRPFGRHQWWRGTRNLGLLLILVWLLGSAWLPQPASAATDVIPVA